MKNTVQICSLCVVVLIVIASVIVPGEKHVAAGAAKPAASANFHTWKVGMSVKVPKDGGEEAFKAWKAAGIDVVELGVPRVDSNEEAVQASAWARQVKGWADEAGIQLWSIHIPFARDLDISNASEAEREKVVVNLRRLIKAYAPLGVEKMVIHGSYEITNPIPLGDREVRIASSHKSLGELAPFAAAVHAQLALEELPRSCLGNTSAEVTRLLAGLGRVGICLDTNHLIKQETPQHFISIVGRRIVTIHVSDNDGIDERHWLPGKGIIDFKLIILGLQAKGYKGPWMFESAGTADEKVADWSRLKDLAAAR